MRTGDILAHPRYDDMMAKRDRHIHKHGYGFLFSELTLVREPVESHLKRLLVIPA